MSGWKVMTGAESGGDRRGTMLAALAVAQMLVGIDYNIVFVALPEIAELGFGISGLQWVISAYAIAFGGSLLLAGRLVDRIGRRPMFLIGLGLFAAGSMLGGLAPSPALLIVGRAIQGVGGAALSPAILALLSSGFTEGAARNRAFGVWGAAGSAGMVLGSILDGVLTQTLGWRAVFFVNIPVVAVVLALALCSIPRDRVPTAASGPLDVIGGVSVTAAAVVTVTGFTVAADYGWRDGATLICFGAAIAVVGFVVIVESRANAPLFPARWLANRHLVAGTGSAFVFMAGYGTLAYFLTGYLQDIRGLSALWTGLVFVIPCLGVLVGTRIGARLATASLRSALVSGNLIGAAALGVLATVIGSHTGWPVLLGLLLILSVGQGIVFTAMFATAATGSPDADQGTIGGIATTGQQLGGAVGLAVLVSLAAGSGDSMRTAIAAIAVVVGIGALIGGTVPRAEPSAVRRPR